MSITYRTSASGLASLAVAAAWLAFSTGSAGAVPIPYQGIRSNDREPVAAPGVPMSLTEFAIVSDIGSATVPGSAFEYGRGYFKPSLGLAVAPHKKKKRWIRAVAGLGAAGTLLAFSWNDMASGVSDPAGSQSGPKASTSSTPPLISPPIDLGRPQEPQTPPQQEPQIPTEVVEPGVRGLVYAAAFAVLIVGRRRKS